MEDLSIAKRPTPPWKAGSTRGGRGRDGPHDGYYEEPDESSYNVDISHDDDDDDMIGYVEKVSDEGSGKGVKGAKGGIKGAKGVKGMHGAMKGDKGVNGGKPGMEKGMEGGNVMDASMGMNSMQRSTDNESDAKNIKGGMKGRMKGGMKGGIKGGMKGGMKGRGPGDTYREAGLQKETAFDEYPNSQRQGHYGRQSYPQGSSYDEEEDGSWVERSGIDAASGKGASMQGAVLSFQDENAEEEAFFEEDDEEASHPGFPSPAKGFISPVKGATAYQDNCANGYQDNYMDGYAPRIPYDEEEDALKRWDQANREADSEAAAYQSPSSKVPRSGGSLSIMGGAMSAKQQRMAEVKGSESLQRDESRRRFAEEMLSESRKASVERERSMERPKSALRRTPRSRSGSAGRSVSFSDGGSIERDDTHVEEDFYRSLEHSNDRDQGLDHEVRRESASNNMRRRSSSSNQSPRGQAWKKQISDMRAASPARSPRQEEAEASRRAAEQALEEEERAVGKEILNRRV